MQARGLTSGIFSRRASSRRPRRCQTSFFPSVPPSTGGSGYRIPSVLHLRWRRSSSLNRAPLYFSRGIVCRHSLLQACATRKRVRELAALFLPSRAPKVPRRWEASAGLRCTVDDGRRRCTVEGAKAPARAPRARARARARGLRVGSLQGEVAHLIIIIVLARNSAMDDSIGGSSLRRYGPQSAVSCSTP